MPRRARTIFRGLLVHVIPRGVDSSTSVSPLRQTAESRSQSTVGYSRRRWTAYG